MEINDYMMATDETAAYPMVLPEPREKNFVALLYCSLKLNGEAGEVAEEFGKALRDDNATITPERRAKIRKESGDVFWYLARICREMGFDPREILDENIAKLRDRKARGVIKGSGSER